MNLITRKTAKHNFLQQFKRFPFLKWSALCVTAIFKKGFYLNFQVDGKTAALSEKIFIFYGKTAGENVADDDLEVCVSLEAISYGWDQVDRWSSRVQSLPMTTSVRVKSSGELTSCITEVLWCLVDVFMVNHDWNEIAALNVVRIEIGNGQNISRFCSSSIQDFKFCRFQWLS